MKSIRFACQLMVCALALGLNAPAQQPASAPISNAAQVDNEFVQKQFGTSCTLTVGVASVTADLDGDGVEDIVIPARCKDPMMDAGDHEYTVIDPYFSFYGYGDPKITTQYSTELPENRALALLVIHGAGADAWRASAPKAKFLIVNLPYKRINAKKMKVKKKTVMAIYVLEAGGSEMTAAIFWDGKKYKYQPMGSSME